MPLTETEAEYLRTLVDDLRVAHTGLLERLEQVRAERDHLDQLATWVSLYFDARSGVTEASIDEIRTEMYRCFVTHRQQWKGVSV